MKKLPKGKTPPDLDTWLHEIEDVTAIVQPEERPSSPLIIEDIPPSVSLEGVYNANSFKYLAVGDLSNIDRNTAEKFAKGSFKIEARLDLHGYTEKTAFVAVQEFIINSYAKGLRCVLIITGKGQRQADDNWYEPKGIIKDALPGWLNHIDVRPFILGMTPAAPADGGQGAMYILLKRHRS